MFRTILSVAGVVATVSIASAAMAGPTIAGPITAKGITPAHQLPAGATMPTLSLYCTVDPSIVSVTLTKGARRGQVQISYEVVNAGSSAWRSGGNQQAVYLRATNANTGGVFNSERPLTAAAAAGASMQRFTTPMINNAFDDFEFAGSLDLRIGYDPDILIDGNRCNDDADTGNNVVHLDNGDILGFMNGPARSQTFRP